MKSTFYRLFALVIIISSISCHVNAKEIVDLKPDTVILPLDSAENMFVRKNYQLLAQRYNISAQQALVLQAKMFPNPTISFSTPIYDQDTKKLFPFGQDGEISAGLSQVILLANKHNKQIKIAQANAQMSEFQFYDLLRTLKHALRSDFINIHFLLQSAEVYQTEIDALRQMSDAFDRQKEKKYVSEKEAIRVKAQYYSLKSEYNDLVQQINASESDLRTILQVSPNLFIVPRVNEAAIQKLNTFEYPLSVLVDSARNTRPDLKMAKLNTNISTLNLQLQKAMAVPDLTLQFNYDQQGSYVYNLGTVGFSIDLPFLDRNQGNIKSAQAEIKENEANYQAVEASVDEQIFSALQCAMQDDKLMKEKDSSFDKDFKRLSVEVLKNYKDRNIGMLDFLDFYDSYKQNTLQTNTIQSNRLNAYEDINYYTGSDMFNFK